MADGGHLGRLDVGEGHAGGGLPLLHLGEEGGEQRLDAPTDQGERLLEAQGVHVVEDVHAGGPEVDDGTSGGALLGPRLDLSHQIVVDDRLDLTGSFDVDVIDGRAQLSKLLGADQTRLALCAGQGEPDAPQQEAFVRLTEDGAHLGAGISPRKGGDKGIMGERLHRPSVHP